MTVQVFLLARSLMPDDNLKVNNQKTYELGEGSSSRKLTFKDKYRRAIFTTTIRLNNVGANFVAHLNPPKKQQGIVLILALIMVVAVTGIAVTLMNSSSIDAKITAAVQEREVAENEVMGTVLKVIANQAAAGRNSAFFKKPEQIPEAGFDLGAIGDSTK